MTEAGTFCRVALARPVLQTFVYRVPPALREAARPGARVRVPFGRRGVVGIVDSLTEETEVERVRDVSAALDPEPLLGPSLLELCRWTADYYAAPPGLVYRAALPPGMLGRGRRPGPGEKTLQVIRIVRSLPTLLERERAFGRAHRQREAYEVLEGLGGRATVAHMEGQLGFGRGVLRGLAERGLAAIEEETVERDPFAELGGDEPPLPTLTPRQDEVLAGLLAQASGTPPGTALLRGVTGSGKTLLYIRCIEAALAAGRGALVLVPEISLTPQTARRFRAAFGDDVAVLHSGLSDGERLDAWRALREGRKRVAVGTRSAVFAPVARPGVIVVDEEHDASYKQGETPRYHARALALVRARLEGALCLLGSATPSLESWWNAREDRYRLYELPERATTHSLPRVELVDLRQEAREAPIEPHEGPRILSRRLADAVRERLARNEQVILLLNRRGFSTSLTCPDCGWGARCRSCNVALVWHRRRGRVVCHHCGFEAPVPAACPACGERDLTFSGVGTEQVEARIGEAFPGARLARMDVDTTGEKWAHERILERVRAREVDLLLGTQMIAKGLDLPGITLVGVLDADTGLNLPDFRAAERTFQLLAQVAGRAGRGDRPGEVIVQTARPSHFAVRTALAHDYPAFAERELADRADPGYPPHRRLANLVVSGSDESGVADAAVALAEWIEGLLADRQLARTDLLGPAPCPIDRLRGRWRWHMLLKGDDAAELGTVLRFVAARAPVPSALRLELDRDPESLL